MSEITAGLHQGRYHQGKLRVNRYNPFVAYVGSESVGEEILINGRQDMNRAFDGDVVAVELLPQSLLPGSQAGKIADRDGEYKKHLSSSSHIISTVKQETISLAVKQKFKYFRCCR
jgi:exosome complex exonuclease DIS3/RRP44